VRRSRVYTGRLHAIEAVIDEAPVLSRELLDVLREAAREVLCPVGLAYAAALPSGSAPDLRERIRADPRGRAARRAAPCADARASY
jgi:primosomal protein N'